MNVEFEFLDHFGGKFKFHFSWFGTIMAGKEPVVESTLCRNILLEHYDLVAAAVIGLTKSSSIRYHSVRNALLILLPRLAAFKRKRFVEQV